MKRFIWMASVLTLLFSASSAFACQNDNDCNDKDNCTSDFCMFGLCQNVYNECSGYSPMSGNMKGSEKFVQTEEPSAPSAGASTPIMPASPTKFTDMIPSSGGVEAPLPSVPSYIATPTTMPMPPGLPKLPDTMNVRGIGNENTLSGTSSELAVAPENQAQPAAPIVVEEPAKAEVLVPSMPAIAPATSPLAPAISDKAPSSLPAQIAPGATTCANGKVLSLMGYRAELARGAVIYVIDSSTCKNTPVRCQIYSVEEKKVKEMVLKDLPRNYGVAVINIPRNQIFEALPVAKELYASEISFCGAQ